MPSPLVISCFKDLTAWLDIFADAELVSVDIFDTLLERRVEPPETVKVIAAQRAADHFAAIGEDTLSPASILAARDEIEASLRRQAQEAGYDYECAFTAIATEVAYRLAPSRKDVLFTALIEGEMEAEREALYPKPGAVELLANLRARGKRVVAVSDMYLDGVLLRRLLDEKGYTGLIDAIYVSADVQLGKYSSRLFRYVMERERISPAYMVHVGDHPHSDFAVPRALGIRAYHLHDVSSLHRRQKLEILGWLSGRNPFWRGWHLLGLIPSREGDFHYRYGYNYLGPIFCGFVLGVVEQAISRGMDKLFFLAREGDLFRLLYLKMAPLLAKNPPPAAYLYVSRKSVFLPASWQGLSTGRFYAVLSNPKQKGLLSIANALGISPQEFAGVAHRFGLKSVDEPILAWNEEQSARLLNDAEFQKIIVRHALPARNLLRRYLEQEGFFGKRPVALVDIGWNGSIQNALRDAFGDEEDFPEAKGLYLSFNDGFNYGFESDEAKGLLYDSRTSPSTHNVFSLFEELFENSARALHGTTIGYLENTQGLVEPILRDDESPDRRSELKFDAHAAALRRGILDFANEFTKAIRLTGYRYADLKHTLISLAERCVVFPSREEVKWLMEMVHTEDFGSDAIMNFRDYQLPGLSALIRPRRLYRLFRSSHWKYGTIRTLGVPGMVRLLRYMDIMLNRSRLHTNPQKDEHRPLLSEQILVVVTRRWRLPAFRRMVRAVRFLNTKRSLKRH